MNYLGALVLWLAKGAVMGATEIITILIAVVSFIGGGGAMWGAVRVQVKQLEKQVDKHDERLDAQAHKVAEMDKAIAGIETNVSLILDNQGKGARERGRLIRSMERLLERHGVPPVEDDDDDGD